MTEDWSKHWNTGRPIDDDLDYYRNDEALVDECLGEIRGQVNVRRVLAARRFGKTSFLRRLDRWAKGKYNWTFVHHFSLLTSTQEIEGELKCVDEIIDAGNKGGDAGKRVLLLIDEFNALLTDESKITILQRFLEMALMPSNPGVTLRVILAAASNMDDIINSQQCKLPAHLRESLLDLRKMYIVGLNETEIRDLMTHAKRDRHNPPDLDDDLKRYAGNHPLFIQYICDAYFNHKVKTSKGFQSYVRKKGIQESQASIYKDLSRKEKLVLRYLLNRGNATANEFTEHGGGGASILHTLKSFGLVKGHSNNAHSIESEFLKQYMKRLPENQIDPKDDTSIEVRTLWPDLFTEVLSDQKSTTWTVHHLGNLHIHTSRTQGQDKVIQLESKVLNAYRHFINESEDNHPRLIIVAGDLAFNDLTVSSFDRFDALGRTFDLVHRELKSISEEMTDGVDADANQVIIAPGDTDEFIRRKDNSEDLVQQFDAFERTFSELMEWQFFRELPMIVAPMNSAILPDDAQEQLEKRYKLFRAQNGDIPLIERYMEHNKSDFGCLGPSREQVSEYLEHKLAKLKSRYRSAADDFDHSLRIAVFHHQFEQLTNAPAVDFLGSYDSKTVLAENDFSLVLNAHALRPFLHSDKVFQPAKLITGCDIHSVGCGSMSQRFVGSNHYPPSFNTLSIKADLLRDPKKGKKYKFTIEVEEVRLEKGRRFFKRPTKTKFEVER